MPEIKCPKCGEVFSVDESMYAEIVSQVRTSEFEGELNRRFLEFQKQKDVELKLAREEEKNNQTDIINALKATIEKMKADAALKEAEERNTIDNLHNQYGKDLAIKM